MTIGTDDRSALLRLARTYLVPHWRGVGVAFGLMLVIGAAAGASAWLLDPAIKKIFLEKDRLMLAVIPLAIVAVMAVRAAAEIAQASIVNRIGHRIVSNVQVQLFSQLMQADLAQIRALHGGETLSSFLYDATLIREAATNGMLGLIRNIITLLALVVVMVAQDPVLAALALIAGPVAYGLTRRLSKRTRKAAEGSMAETAELASRIMESLDGVRMVKLHNREAAETARIAQIVERRVRHIIAAANAKVAAGPLTEAVGGVGAALVIAYAGWRGLSGAMDLGDFVSFLTALLMAFQPLRQISNLQTVLAEGAAAARRTFPVLDLRPTIDTQPGAHELHAPRGNIALEHVDFDYADGTAALHDISLHAHSGETVALVGPSGGGKSTLLNLIPRFYDVTSGHVRLDGHDVRQLTLPSLRAAIAMVTQDPFLFDDTVYANIHYGRPDATHDDVIAAARAADAHDFINALPFGYDTVVGEGGARLSGGQKQRIAIARAFLKNAPVLLLDEATSALDTESETHIQDALARLRAGRTVIVIAHRLSTVRRADRIYVLEAGRITEQGTHDALMHRGGTYARLAAHGFEDTTP